MSEATEDTDADDTDDTDDTAAAAMSAAQITEPLAMLARGADRMPLLQMPSALSFDGTNVTAFTEKRESLARSTSCDATASAVIGDFPCYCTEDVRETVFVQPGYCDDGSRSWSTLRG